MYLFISVSKTRLVFTGILLILFKIFYFDNFDMNNLPEAEIIKVEQYGQGLHLHGFDGFDQTHQFLRKNSEK